MSHISHPCMYMAVHAYANEMLMRLGRSLDDYFHKTTQPFLMCFKEIIFRLKIIVYSDEIYIKRIYLVSRTDLVHMLRD